MKRYVIDSERDIREFFTDLHFRTRKLFSPEDDLADMVTAWGNAVFSKAEVAYFDDIILDCFVFCSDHHLDLHEIVERVQQELCLYSRLGAVASSRERNFNAGHRQTNFFKHPYLYNTSC